MLPTTGNILDQLLGGFDTAQIPTVGSSQQAGAADGMPFGNLLSMLLNGQGVVVAPTVATPELASTEVPVQEVVPFEQFLSKMTSSETAEVPVEIVAGKDLEALIANSSAGWLEDLPAAERDLPQIVLPNRPNTIIESSFIANQNLRDLMSSQPVALESAIYKVLDAGINGDNLELTVVADGNNPEPVKLTVPAELLTGKEAGNALAALRGGNAKFASATGLERIALTDVVKPAAENLDELLSKMNLKAVEVKLEPVTNAAATEKQQVTLQLFGVVNGNQIVIKSKLDKQQIDCRTNDKTIALLTPKAQSGSPEANAGKSTLEAVKLETRQTERPVAIPIQDASRRMPFDLIDKLTADKNTTLLETTGLPTDHLTAKTEMMAKLNSETTAVPTAKLTLPPAFDKIVRPGGQSIMLKIEPEHLGPARLNLSIENNVLTARVTVESPLAKMAVEHSLQQLTDQLTRAGINVDRIEVAMSDRESREQFFHRRPDWAQPDNTGGRQTDEAFELEQVTPSPTLYIPSTEFVRAGGVNLLA